MLKTLEEQNLDVGSLAAKAKEIRTDIIKMVYGAQSGHIGGSMGAVEILVYLYFHIMKHDPKCPDLPDRDRFILSKGHCTPVLYSTLARCGYFPLEDLQSFRRPGSHLQGHPYQPKTPGVEVSTGTLGLGISTGVGMALAAKMKNQSHFYYVLCGDGEIQEGQVWEAAMFANKYSLDNIIVFVDRNYLQTDGNSEKIMPLDPLDEKWESFGWHVATIDGHDYNQINNAVIASKKQKKPAVIVAKTTKGKGVSFMENAAAWHGKPPTTEEFEKAMIELQ